MRGSSLFFKIRIWSVCLFLCLGLLGCGLRPRQAPEEDRRTKGEKQFDPLGFPQDREVVTEKEPGKNKTTDQEKDKKKKLTESEKKQTSFPRKVYRVQFFATQYPDEASTVADLVKNQLSENTYVDYKAPYYWVRVGDCQTKEEAGSLLEKIVGLGYKESWVVEAKIEQ
ncbi:MAG: SPOR domain-containing protein [Candidatus Zixiibacteriota bacterium]